uniref:Uncharacterized protein n=1 Tax=Avena sativa TaxID=4498 RepID=A0ACD5V8A4_AVESA
MLLPPSLSPSRARRRASHYAAVSSSWSSQRSPPRATLRHADRSWNAFSRPSTSSKHTISTSQNCSMPATAVYRSLCTVSSNFFTISASSSVAPRLAYLAVMPLIFPAYTSSASLSAMTSRSKSSRSVDSRAALTRSAPTNRALRLAHTSAAIFFDDTCSRMSSASALSRYALAVFRIDHRRRVFRNNRLPDALCVKVCLDLDRPDGVVVAGEHRTVERHRAPPNATIWSDRKHSSTDRSSSPGLLDSESMAAPEWVPPAVELASSWLFPAVALSSLVAHLFLVFLSGIRRRQASGVARILLWLAYQVNNWAPIYVLGNLYFDTEPHEKQLYAFWVPFLMLHLARPDNISAYSMEDNKLAGRVMLFVPFQSVGAFTIIYRYIHVDSTTGTLRPASWIMFSLAFFKYVESVMALRRGGLDNIRSSFKPRKSRKTGGHGGGDEEGSEEDMEVENDPLLVAHDLLDICKGAFTDYPVKMDIRERQRVDYFGWEKMPQVVEMELSLMYDMMYTKAAMVHTWGGYGIRVVSPFLTATAFLLFWFRHRDQGLHSSRDVDISYILLGTTFILDVTWLLRAIGSTWAHAFFKESMAAPEWVPPAVELASSWLFPAVALSSLVAHLFLVFLSGIRRRQASGVARVFLWLAYQVNNWAPIYVLGNLYFDTEPHKKQLYAFWVPFLMLHLARPDNISAYSMEDNKLAGRVMLFVPFQSVGAFTIIYRYIHVDSTTGTLRPASWIMFSLAFFKYVESVMALRRGDLDNIRSSFKPRKSRKTGGHGGGDEEGSEEDMEVEKDPLLVAHDLLDISKGAFTDYPVKMDIRERQRVDYFGWEKMPQVVEMELSLMYDMMYTKAAMVHTWGGYGIRVVSPFLTATAFLLFWFRHRDQGLHSSRDVDISYILLGTTFILDVTWLLRAIGSTWAHAFFKGTRWQCVKLIVFRGRWKRIRRLVVSLDLLRDKKPSSYRAWSGILGQHNLLRDFGDTQRFSSKLAKRIGLEESWNAHCYSGQGTGLDFKIDAEVRDKLFEQIGSLIHMLPGDADSGDDASDDDSEDKSQGHGHERQRELDLALGFDQEIEEVILIWHIATEVFLCCAQQEDCPEWDPDIEEMIRAISNYMLFLIAVRPGMIPGLKVRNMYEHTLSALNKLRGDDSTTHPTAGVDVKKLVLIMLDKVIDTNPNWNLILSDGTRCALLLLRQISPTWLIFPRKFLLDPGSKVVKTLEELCPKLFGRELGMPAMWLEMPTMLDMPVMLGRILDVWVHLLIYASIRCSPDSHAQQLGQGGELTTIIWILIQHRGKLQSDRLE